jgi:hypothetical protein
MIIHEDAERDPALVQREAHTGFAALRMTMLSRLANNPERGDGIARTEN